MYSPWEEIAAQIIWVTDPDASWCTAHLERKGEKVPVFKLGLCARCFEGFALSPIEKVGLLEESEDAIIKIRIGHRNKHEGCELTRKRKARAKRQAREARWQPPMIFAVVRIFTEEGEQMAMFSITNLNPQQHDAYERIAGAGDLGMQIVGCFLRGVQSSPHGCYFEDVLKSPHFQANAALQQEFNAHAPEYESALRILFGDSLRSRPAPIGTPVARNGIIDSTGRGAPKQISLSLSESKDAAKYRSAKLEAGENGVVVVHPDDDKSTRLFMTPGSAPGTLPLLSEIPTGR